MRVGSIQNYQSANINFKAQIGDTNYLREGVRYWGSNGTIEQKTKLLNYLQQIKQDENIGKVYFYKKDNNCSDEVGYYARIDNGEPMLIDGPYAFSREKIKTAPNTYSYAQDIKNFIYTLGYFIKKHYGEGVFEKLTKQEPECVKEYHTVQKRTDMQLRTDLRNALDFEPLHSEVTGDGRVIPTDELGLPLKEPYIC